MYKKTAAVAQAEKHNAEVSVLLFQNGKLFSGGNDGKIKIWTGDLKLEKTIDAHSVNVYDISACDKYLYSSSNDSTLKVWDINTGNFVQSLAGNQAEDILKLFCTSNKLYSGDVRGNVNVFQNHELVGTYDMFEDITGLCAKDNYLFTSGTLDLVVTELKPGHKNQYTTRKTQNGRGPICLLNEKLCFLDREGRVISILDIDHHEYNITANLQGHSLIVNALCGNEHNCTLYSGGYDKLLKVWDVNASKNLASVDIGKCINAIASDGKQIFIAGDDGVIERLSPT